MRNETVTAPCPLRSDGSSLYPKPTKRLRVLVLLPFAPDLRGDHGGSRAAAAIIEALGRRHEVKALYLRAADETAPRQLPKGMAEAIEIGLPAKTRQSPGRLHRAFDAARELVRGPPDWARSTASASMHAAIRSVAASFDPDVVQMEFHVMGQYLPTARASAPRARCIVTEHEPGVASGAALQSNPLRRLRLLANARAWARFERHILPEADAVVTFTDRDRNTIAALLGTRAPHLACIPLRLSPPPCLSGAEGAIASDLLFIGNFAHPPNVDAAVRLALSIFPKVRKALPDARLIIIGANPPVELASTAFDGVTVTGWIDETAPYLTGTKLVVAPLRLGGGMRVKVIEACASGKALLTSSRAIEGLPLRAGVDCAVAESDEAFAAAAVALLSDPEKRQRLGDAARAWAERWLDAETWADDYDALYRRIGMLPSDGRAADAGQELLR